ncbi:hypothetical protein FGG08_006365 [Glutinoglossum americanum]|uniref:Uncharacterized protein n=1 Tax=Glutinoglossum americanum TaxID=1670608 RepID=A0A9P8I1P6_9PEZI|nr:hypothetical protein FGG08_006365 [Glutinoglossum americanum]
MNPAIAVLILPTKQWLDINQQDGLSFGQLESPELPALSEALAPQCANPILPNDSYSCTQYLYGSSMDQLVASAVPTDYQVRDRNGVYLPPISRGEDLTFSFNVSDTAIWIPSRQAVRLFSSNLTDYHNAASSSNIKADYPQFRLFNSSLEVRLQLYGPAIGLTSFCVIRNTTIYFVDSARKVRCY